MGKKRRLLMLLLLMGVGLGVLLYPMVTSAVNQRRDSCAIREWARQMERLGDEDLGLRLEQLTTRFFPARILRATGISWIWAMG